MLHVVLKKVLRLSFEEEITMRNSEKGKVVMHVSIYRRRSSVLRFRPCGAFFGGRRAGSLQQSIFHHKNISLASSDESIMSEWIEDHYGWFVVPH